METPTMHDLFDGSNAEELTDADAFCDSHCTWLDHSTDCDNNKALEAWDEIMKIAREHALIVAAYDGVATLALPAAQKEHGWFERCQYNHMRGQHPKSIDSGESETPNVK